MSQEFESDLDEIGRTRSGKKYSRTVQTVFDNRVLALQKNPRRVYLTILIPRRNRPELRITP